MPTTKYKNKDYYKSEEYLSKRRAYARSLREKIFNHYGAACVCCKEDTNEFLTLDHINNDGATHRMSIFGRNKTGGYPFYLWVIRNNYPDDLQVMCMNCNMAKRIYGKCPHKVKSCEECGEPMQMLGEWSLMGGICFCR